MLALILLAVAAVFGPLADDGSAAADVVGGTFTSDVSVGSETCAMTFEILKAAGNGTGEAQVGNGQTACLKSAAAGTVVIPQSVTDSATGKTYAVIALGDAAFSYRSGLTAVIVPSSVTAIGVNTFYQCLRLEAVAIPSSVTAIGLMAFAGCSSLNAISVDAGSTAYSSDDQGILYNKGRTELVVCPGGNAGAMAIPTTVTAIDAYAFYGCTGVTEVNIPNGVRSIGEHAFAMTALTEIKIPASVTAIGSGAFSRLNGLTAISVDAGNLNYASDSQGVFYNKACTTLIQCPGAFQGQLTVPGTVTDIAVDACYACAGITGLALPDGLLTISNYAFSNCTRLTAVVLPAATVTLGSAAFAGCSALRSVTMTGVESVGSAAFSNCPALQEIALPAVQSVSSAAFNGCTGLTSLLFGAGLKQLASDACDGLTLYSEDGVTALDCDLADLTSRHFTGTYARLIRVPLYEVTVAVSGDGGSVAGGGVGEAGSTVNISATPDDGFIFSSWSDGSRDSDRRIVVNGDQTYTATFVRDQRFYYDGQPLIYWVCELLGLIALLGGLAWYLKHHGGEGYVEERP